MSEKPMLFDGGVPSSPSRELTVDQEKRLQLELQAMRAPKTDATENKYLGSPNAMNVDLLHKNLNVTWGKLVLILLCVFVFFFLHQIVDILLR